MPIAITGANGFVAKHLRKYLSTMEIPVIAIGRHNFPIFRTESKIITDKYSDNLISKLKKCTCLIHLIGSGKQTIDNNYYEVNFQLTKQIVELCNKSKISKIIFNSGLGVSKNSTTDYFISKYKAEKEIINSGLDYTIFRPSYIIGTNDLLTKNLKQQIRRGEIKIPGSGNFSLQPITITNVVQIIYQSITSKKYSKKILDLVGPEVITYEKFIKLFLGTNKTPIQKTSIEHAYYDAITNPRSLFGVDDLHILVGNFIGNHNKLKQLSDLEFENFRKILKTSSFS